MSSSFAFRLRSAERIGRDLGDVAALHRLTSGVIVPATR
jgi:hypothetical protein